MERRVLKQKREPFVWLLKQSRALFKPSNQWRELLRETRKILQPGWTTWK